MLLHCRPCSSEKFIFITTCISIVLFHQVDGFPVIAKEARVVLYSPPLPILPSSDDARWFDSSDSPTVSDLVTRSSSDVVHDKVFIPTIASIGVLVIICIFCCYKVIRSKQTALPMGAPPIISSRDGYNEPPILHSQHAIGRQENGYGGGPLSRGLSKVSRKSPSTLASVHGSPSVRSDTIGYHHHLQQQRQQQQLQQFQQQQQQQQQQDPYRQYMMANDQGYPQQHHQHTPHPSVANDQGYPQHHQYTPHPSVAGSVGHRGQGVQPQPLHGVQTHATRPIGPDPTGNGRDPRTVVQTVQPPFPNAAVQQPAIHQTPMNANPAVGTSYWGQEHQNLQQQQQQQQADPRISHISSGQTSSTRVTSSPSDILSYMATPEAHRPPLPSNQAQTQNQDYFSIHPTGSTTLGPSQTGGSTTHGFIPDSIPANLTPGSRAPSFPNSAHAAHGYTNTHVNSNQPPGYTETRIDVQGKSPYSEKKAPRNLNG
ncbi:hypothetical protein BYT27DRAFT_7193830 [Phlegmacium glaucopus]|nr:hypothetical protein BYT27DRAFT_7193830 [Phlegmacium glaucopus]